MIAMLTAYALVITIGVLGGVVSSRITLALSLRAARNSSRDAARDGLARSQEEQDQREGQEEQGQRLITADTLRLSVAVITIVLIGGLVSSRNAARDRLARSREGMGTA